VAARLSPRFPWPLAFLAAALIAVGGAVLVADGPDGGGGQVSATDPPTAYHAVFRVQSGTGDAVGVSTERVWVLRPFVARVEVAEGSPPGGRVLSTSVHRFGVSAVEAAGSQRLITTAPVAPPPPDLRFDAVADELVAQGQARGPGATRSVEGRACREFVLHPPELEDGARRLCVDGAGLVIDDALETGGETIRRRTLVDLDLDPAVPEHLFRLGGVIGDVDEGRGGWLRVTDDSRAPGAPAWELDAAPAGLRHRGRFVISPPPQTEDTFGVPVPLAAAVVDAWVSGPDVVVVENGGTRDLSATFDPDEGREVELGALGTGRLVVSTHAIEVRAVPSRGRSVIVRGTLRADRLLAIARALREVEGGVLTPLAP